mgnify:CR=1 FL=1
MINIGYQENLIRDLIKLREEEKINYFNVENDIKRGYIIARYEKLPLEEKELYDGKIKIILPKSFNIMEEDLLHKKYSLYIHPDYVYTSEDTTINFNFNLEEGNILNEDIEEIRGIILKQFSRMYPSSKMEDIEILQTEEKKIGTFSFTIPVLDGYIFNKIYFVPIKIGLLIVSFNCDVFQKKEWRAILNDIILTIKEDI